MRACFVHMPKCGGTSVRVALEQLLGVQHLKLDYVGVPAASEQERHRKLLDYVRAPEPLEQGCCVYGHFRPVKYLGDLGDDTKDIQVLAIVRDPIERLVSHYRYLRAVADSSNQAYQELSAHGFDFAWFANQPRLRNIYSRHFYQVPLARVAYLGLYERLDLAWSQIAMLLRPGAARPSLPLINSTDQRSACPVPPPAISELLRSELEELHGEDLALYAEAQRRQAADMGN